MLRKQCLGSVFIWYGSGSSILGWIPIRIRIRIQSGSRVLMPKKITAEKIFFWSKTTIYLFPGLHKGRQSFRRSLQLSKENIQHLKTWNLFIFFSFCGSFLPSWIWIRIHWLDWIRIRNIVRKEKFNLLAMLLETETFYSTVHFLSRARAEGWSCVLK